MWPGSALNNRAAITSATTAGPSPHASVERQFACAMGLMAVPLFLHALFLHPVAFAIVAFFAGALIAPSITAQSVLVSRLAPAKYATEAFTWSSTFIVSGIGTGVAVGGYIVETAGLRAAFASGGVIMAAMALLMIFAFPTQAEASEPRMNADRALNDD